MAGGGIGRAAGLADFLKPGFFFQQARQRTGRRRRGGRAHHPAQIARPDWLCPFDTDSAQAQATREAFLARYADTPTLILGTHFANPVGGRIVRDGDSYRFDV